VDSLPALPPHKLFTLLSSSRCSTFSVSLLPYPWELGLVFWLLSSMKSVGIKSFTHSGKRKISNSINMKGGRGQGSRVMTVLRLHKNKFQLVYSYVTLVTVFIVIEIFFRVGFDTTLTNWMNRVQNNHRIELYYVTSMKIQLMKSPTVSAQWYSHLLTDSAWTLCFGLHGGCLSLVLRLPRCSHCHYSRP